MIFQRRYEPLNRIEVLSKNIVHNMAYFSSLKKGLKTAPVLKSNAYGHGLGLIGKLLDTSGAPFFCVDSLYEAYELAKVGVKTPILIMGNIDPESLHTKRLPFSFAVSNPGGLSAVSRYQPHAPIHLFVDTGMHREGFVINELPNLLKEIKQKNIMFEGLMSHFAAAEKCNSKDTVSQLRNFELAQKMVYDAGLRPKWVHMCATSGAFHVNDFKNYSLGNLARIGIGLYGYDPEGKNMSLRPALKLVSTLSQIKHLHKGDKIGYDFTFTAKKEMTIGVLPIGYNDGISRRLSNTGVFLLNGMECPVIGRISMNITSIDISSGKDSTVGQEVTIISEKKEATNSLAKVAELAGSIPYEMLVGLNPLSIRRNLV